MTKSELFETLWQALKNTDIDFEYRDEFENTDCGEPCMNILVYFKYVQEDE
jgi:hypothetical protein